jgi:hypothetical protein
MYRLGCQGNGFSGTKRQRVFSLSKLRRVSQRAGIAGVDRAVPWTQPDDFKLDPANPVASLGSLPEGCVLCVTADRESLPLSTTIQPAELMALATPRGKEVVDCETLRRAFQESFRVLLAKRMQEEGKPATRDITRVTAQVAGDGRSRRLKRIANALYDFHMAYKQFPVSERNRDAFDAEGKPHLSWRVHLLPMLDHAPLYDITELLTLHQGTKRTKRPDRR